MKYFTKTAVSTKALNSALKARTRYIEEALKVIPEGSKLRKEILLNNKAQIERMANSIFGKG